MAVAVAVVLALALESLGPPRLGTDERLPGPSRIPVPGHPVSSDHLCKNKRDKLTKALNKKPMVKSGQTYIPFTPIISASSVSGPYFSIILLPLLTLSWLITLIILLSATTLSVQLHSK